MGQAQCTVLYILCVCLCMRLTAAAAAALGCMVLVFWEPGENWAQRSSFLTRIHRKPIPPTLPHRSRHLQVCRGAGGLSVGSDGHTRCSWLLSTGLAGICLHHSLAWAVGAAPTEALSDCFQCMLCCTTPCLPCVCQLVNCLITSLLCVRVVSGSLSHVEGVGKARFIAVDAIDVPQSQYLAYICR